VTISQAIEQASALLGSSCCDDSGWQALILAAHVLGRKPGEMCLVSELPFGDDLKLEAFFSLVEKRISGIPLQHVIGEWDFYGRTFKTDCRALIPRQETELLVDFIVSCRLPEHPTILDVGTGSGVIGISLALEIPGSIVTGTDISLQALELANENRLLLGAVNYSTVCCYLTDTVFGQFDVIAANLPYIASDDIAGLQAEVRDHDPHSALDGGEHGTLLILELVRRAPGLLRSGGQIVLETGHDQEKEVLSFFSEEMWCDIQAKRDLAGEHRIVAARRM